MNANVSALYCAIVLGWGMTFCVAATSCGQEKNQTTQVAVLDIAEVFKKYKSFNDKLEAIKVEAKALKKASEDGEGGVGELVKQRAELQDREAEIYAESYQEVQAAVEKIADEYGILLVVRADTSQDVPSAGQFLSETESTDIEKERGSWKGLSRAEVIKRINSNVIYHKQLDLTRLVIKTLEKASNVSAAAGKCEHCGQSLKKMKELKPR